MNTKTKLCGAAGAGLCLMSLAACDHNDNFPITPVLADFTNQTTIGSTTDPVGLGLNPYGLSIAQATVGLLNSGDLIVCNFNDSSNVQGTGTTIVALHPEPGATPTLIANSPQLLGCSAVAALPDGNIVAAASQANALVLVSSVGTITTPYASDTFANPWSVTFADSPNGPALYVSNAGNGTIDRINLSGADAQTGFTEIATGFAWSGVPGTIAAPSGLSYDPFLDQLYIVDTSTNSVVAFSSVSMIGTDGVVVSVGSKGDSFSGPSAAAASIVAAGAPLNLPISAALLQDGNLIVGNTGDPSGTNLLLEIWIGTGVVAERNVDTGGGGALFGIAIGQDSFGNPIVYFNDDNANNVQELSF